MENSKLFSCSNSKIPFKKSKVVVAYHFFAHYRKGIVQELNENGFHNYLFAGDEKDPRMTTHSVKPMDMEEKIPFIRAPCHGFPSGIIIQKGLINLGLRRDVDTVIYLGNSKWPSTWIGAITAKLFRKKVLFWTIGWLQREKGLKALLRSSFYKIADGLLLYGDRAKRIAIEKGFEAERIYAIYNSLDLKEQKTHRKVLTDTEAANIRRKLFGDNERPVVVCTSRLVKKRRLDLLIDAVAELKSKDKSIDVLIVGDGPEKRQLQKIAENKGVRVCFYGPCYDESVLANLIACANVTVAPGMVGLTAMHSMAYGTPVISHGSLDHQAPEVEAIIPGITGDFFRENDYHDLASVIDDWTDTVLPDIEAKKRCFKVIEKFYNPTFQRIMIDCAVSGIGSTKARELSMAHVEKKADGQQPDLFCE